MEVVNARSALLSNYEVLSLLRELEADHLSRTKTAVRLKKEEEASGGISSIIPGEKHPTHVEILQNLRTIEVEAIKYLSADYQAATSQTDEGIAKLVKGLGAFDLTKAEKLQIVNLAPTLPVELYVIVEEMEDRLGESMEDMLAEIKASLTPAPTANNNALSFDADMSVTHNPDAAFWSHEDADADEMEFDDRGEGAGIEGDLDVDDD